jgi:very-short-patch-repair endonuclease
LVFPNHPKDAKLSPVNPRDLFRESANGVLTWAELRPHITKTRLLALVRTRQIVDDGGGTYRLAAVAPRYGIAIRLRGTLSHASAAEHWRLPLLRDPTETHVTVDPSRSRVKRDDKVRVYFRELPDGDVVDGVTSITRTLLDCARDLPLPDAMSIIDGALRDKGIIKDDLIDAAHRLRGPHCKKVQQIVSWGDDRAASVMESGLRGVLLTAGITQFEPQFPVRISNGMTYHADLGDATSRILIEADSFLNHGSRNQLRADAHRYDEFVAAGYVVLRFTWPHIMDHRTWLVDMVRRALAHRQATG